MLAEACENHDIQPAQLTVHADRGKQMTGKQVAHLLADVGVTRTHNRPYTSNDNPFSEAQFKTLEYRPNFPGRFGCQEDAVAFCREFFRWYNDDHRHSGIGMLTPADLHFGRADTVRVRRTEVLARAYDRHPERFVRGLPVSPRVPTRVWINPPVVGQGDRGVKDLFSK